MTVVILDGKRTPFGKWNGALAAYSAVELASRPLAYLIEKYPALGAIDAVILAQVIQAGQGQNSARQVAYQAGLDSQTPAITLNSVCLGGIATIADAARRIMLGEGETFVVGGMDSMSNAPYVVRKPSRKSFGHQQLTDTLLHDGLWCALSDQSMGVLTETYNKKLQMGREAQDHFALLSQQRAQEAKQAGRLAEEIVAYEDILTEDEGIRANTTLGKLANLRPAFQKDGTITAGNASQMTDGASIGIVTSLEKAESIGVEPLATVVDWAETAGPDTSLQTKPSDAIKKLLAKQELTTDEIDLFEINEAFASVVIASANELAIDESKINVNGGAIAIGHPLGGTGFRLVLTLAYELKRRGGGRGIASLCGGGGQGMAILIEVPKKGATA